MIKTPIVTEVAGWSSSAVGHVASLVTYDGHLSEVAWSTVMAELNGFRNLNDDWDGEGTAAPEANLLDSAIELAQELQADASTPPDRVHVGVNSTVFFEWYTSLGYCEIEVMSPMEAESRFVRNGADTADVVRLLRQK